MAPRTRKLLSVVTPCYHEEANVEACYHEVKRVFAELLPEYDREHIFSDNASTDGTVDVLRRLATEDPAVKIIVNARNYGPFRSTFNALLRTSGDAVVVMLPADLQDPPELIADFVRHWEKGYEIVYGIRANREEGILLRIARSIYYRLVARFAEIEIPRNATTTTRTFEA
jgi:glycosyltransferase involved in cell wall biosynthesis